jgi:hypothetical protein
MESRQIKHFVDMKEIAARTRREKRYISTITLVQDNSLKKMPSQRMLA